MNSVHEAGDLRISRAGIDGFLESCLFRKVESPPWLNAKHVEILWHYKSVSMRPRSQPLKACFLVSTIVQVSPIHHLFLPKHPSPGQRWLFSRTKPFPATLSFVCIRVLFVLASNNSSLCSRTQIPLFFGSQIQECRLLPLPIFHFLLLNNLFISSTCQSNSFCTNYRITSQLNT